MSAGMHPRNTLESSDMEDALPEQTPRCKFGNGLINRATQRSPRRTYEDQTRLST